MKKKKRKIPSEENVFIEIFLDSLRACMKHPCCRGLFSRLLLTKYNLLYTCQCSPEKESDLGYANTITEKRRSQFTRHVLKSNRAKSHVSKEFWYKSCMREQNRKEVIRKDR